MSNINEEREYSLIQIRSMLSKPFISNNSLLELHLPL